MQSSRVSQQQPIHTHTHTHTGMRAPRPGGLAAVGVLALFSIHQARAFLPCHNPLQGQHAVVHHTNHPHRHHQQQRVPYTSSSSLALVMTAAASSSSSSPLWTIRGGASTTETSSTSSTAAVAPDDAANPPPADIRVPITLVSGFLGSGKTTLLKHVLENKEGLRVGVIVNDMASINIDAKLIRNDPKAKLNDTVELQNGCACCTMRDELFNALYELLTLAQMREVQYDHIVIETTGIAEPKAIRANFHAAEDYAMPLMDIVRLDTMVTVVDSGVFLDAYISKDTLMKRPELGLSEVEVLDIETRATAQREVAELLVEQVEYADVVILNKDELLTPPSRRALLHEVVQTLNPWAVVVPANYSKVPLEEFLGVNEGKMGVALSGALDDHKESVEGSVRLAQEAAAAAAKAKHDHGHEHEVKGGAHQHAHDDEADHDPTTCTDPTHDHSKDVQSSHSHLHAHAHDEHDHDPATCTDPTHDHSHDHKHGKEEECHEPGCTDPTHNHSHDHSSHSHDKTASQTTAESRFRIGTSVYLQRRPFHPDRFADFVEELAASSYVSLENIIGKKKGGGGQGFSSSSSTPEKPKPVARVMTGLLRSKGFIWLACTDAAALYYSHAGRTLSVSCMGRWWASVPEEQWPQEREGDILADFEGDHGDRRNELVFIGVGLFEKENQALLRERLDECLLTDEEMQVYREKAADASAQALFEAFPNRIEIDMAAPPGPQ